MTGWVKLWRKLLDNEVLQHETRLALFVRMLLRASAEPCEVWFKGKTRQLGRGQLWLSERDEAHAISCDRQRIRSALTVLQKAGIVTRTITQDATLISIVNFDTYQNGAARVNPDPNPRVNPELTQAQPTEQEEEEDKKGEGNQDSSPAGADDEHKANGKRPPKDTQADFERFWTVYPRKVGKGAARLKFDAALRHADIATLLAGVGRYVANKPAHQDWCHPATWLHQQRWLDEERVGQGEGTVVQQFDRRPSKGANIIDVVNKLKQWDAQGVSGYSSSFGEAESRDPPPRLITLN